MAEPDRARWGAFLARVEKRAAKRVLIGASPMRLAELQGGLAAAGYAVTGGTDPGAIAQLASGDAHPVDAALVDAAWVADGPSSSWIESLFSARNVPCVTIHGDARRARVAIRPPARCGVNASVTATAALWSRREFTTVAFLHNLCRVEPSNCSSSHTYNAREFGLRLAKIPVHGFRRFKVSHL